MGSVKTEKGGVCHVNPTCVLVLHCGEDLSCQIIFHFPSFGDTVIFSYML